MTRATQMKHGVPVEPAPTLLDGVPHTCVVVRNSLPFAKACVKLMGEADGKDHGWKLRQNAFWVPDALIPRARAMVEAAADEVKL